MQSMGSYVSSVVTATKNLPVTYKCIGTPSVFLLTILAILTDNTLKMRWLHSKHKGYKKSMLSDNISDTSILIYTDAR